MLVNMTTRQKWWVPAYLWALLLFANTFGVRPDLQKVYIFLIKHGFRVVVEKAE